MRASKTSTDLYSEIELLKKQLDGIKAQLTIAERVLGAQSKTISALINQPATSRQPQFYQPYVSANLGQSRGQLLAEAAQAIMRALRRQS
jgi:hypothetical protein